LTTVLIFSDSELITSCTKMSEQPRSVILFFLEIAEQINDSKNIEFSRY